MKLQLGDQWADIPDMPDEFSWDTADGCINVYQRNTGARAPAGREVMGYVSRWRHDVKFRVYLSRLGSSGCAKILETTNLQEAIDLLATRVMLGGADYSELP